MSPAKPEAKMSEEPKQKSTENRNFFWPKSVISIGAAVATLASVLYDYAYFHWIGYPQSGFATMSDVIASAISWLPPTIALLREHTIDTA
jgi:hypothetical protein